MRQLPSIDLHAHLDINIPQFELRQLGAVIFAATRSLDEATTATLRSDEQTIWGAGCHPGLMDAQKAFERKRFKTLIQRTPFVGEVGLDGSSKVPMNTQLATFKAILQELQNTPRIVSVHSYMATDLVIDALEAQPKSKGVVLHWWLGDIQQTQRAIELGCFFSLNTSSVHREDVLKQIPLDRVLTETDHPFGDRRGSRNARPGQVTVVEDELAQHFAKTPEDIRLAIWDNLARLTSEADCTALLPRAVRLKLMAR